MTGAAIGLCLWLPDALWAGEYLNSAHGSSTAGVERPGTTAYATGNCVHCHEMHATIAGTEPLPSSGGPSAYTLFASNFNSSAVPGSYLVADNFCFYCHSASASVQAVINADYSTTFGGDASGTLPQYIMEAFNQLSYHDLGDVNTFVDGEDGLFPWYNQYSNPCNACHNPHLAKRNYDDFSTPLSSALSKPSDHFSLWGDSADNSETMAKYSRYEAPFANESSGNREPDNTSTTSYASKTPDYASFCTDCHQYAIGSLQAINWGVSGDKHGVVARDARVGATSDTSLDGRNPYESVDSTTGNFVLSCLDCHEPHGSPNIMLLRRRVNGESVDVTSLGSIANLCARCHSGNWEYIHHDSADRPYAQIQCGSCHPGGGGGGGSPDPIPCSNCHMHGMTDPKGTGRRTF